LSRRKEKDRSWKISPTTGLINQTPTNPRKDKVYLVPTKIATGMSPLQSGKMGLATTFSGLVNQTPTNGQIQDLPLKMEKACLFSTIIAGRSPLPHFALCNLHWSEATISLAEKSVLICVNLCLKNGWRGILHFAICIPHWSEATVSVAERGVRLKL